MLGLCIDSSDDKYLGVFVIPAPAHQQKGNPSDNVPRIVSCIRGPSSFLASRPYGEILPTWGHNPSQERQIRKFAARPMRHMFRELGTQG